MDELDAPADRQRSSGFFSMLPAEVRRLIYIECWRHNELHDLAPDQDGQRTLKHHIFKRGSGYTHSPCVVSDQTAPDFRSQRLAALNLGGRNPRGHGTEVWTDRIESEWAVHWPCQEIYKMRASSSVKEPETFMSVLLTCKLMYTEALPAIFSSVTFVLTDIFQAHSFLQQYPPSTPRSLELCLRMPPTFAELYTPSTGPGAVAATSLPQNFPFDVTNNPWARLCTSLARCTNLRRLDVWLDHKHLGPWSDRMHERAFLAALNDVRTRSRNDFVLALPEIKRDQGAPATALWRRRQEEEGRYLVGSYLDDLPFVVVRAPRPDYWAAHLVKVTHRSMEAFLLSPPDP